MNDLTRWENPENLRPEWDERTKLLAAEIPRNSFVVDFGAGSEALRRFLPSDCKGYLPIDVIKRTPETIVADLNDFHGIDGIPRNYVAVFSGVLEYVEDIDLLFSWLDESGADLILASYATREGILEVEDRRSQGWVEPGLSDADIFVSFLIHGFNGKGTIFNTWNNQTLYRFERKAK